MRNFLVGTDGTFHVSKPIGPCVREEGDSIFFSEKMHTEYVKPDVSGLATILKNVSATNDVQDIDNVPYVRIELDSKIVLVVNSSRKTAVSLAQKKYGLREFASRLTRFTGPIGQRIGDFSEDQGSYFIDKELASSLAEDLLAIHNNKEVHEMPKFVSTDPEYDFLLQVEGYPRGVFSKTDPSSSMYAVTRKNDSPGYKLGYQNMIDSYYAMFHFDESMDGIGDDTDLPSGFHLVLPLLHHGVFEDEINGKILKTQAQYKSVSENRWVIQSDQLSDCEKDSINEAINAATQFISDVLFWPSDSVNASYDELRPKGTTRKEFIVCYEENKVIWDALIVSLRNEFSLSIQQESKEQVFENVDLSVPHGHDILAGVLDDTSDLIRFRNRVAHDIGYYNGLRKDHLDNFWKEFQKYEYFSGGLEIYDRNDITQLYYYIPKGVDASTAIGSFKWSTICRQRLIQQAKHLLKAKIYSKAAQNLSGKETLLHSTIFHYHNFTEDAFVSTANSDVIRNPVSQQKSISQESTIVRGNLSVNTSPSDENTVIETYTINNWSMDNPPLDILHDFVIANQGDNFEDLINELREDGHKGSDEMIFMEHIVSKEPHTKLIGLISDMVPWVKIKEQLKEFGSERKYAHTEKADAVNELLNHFGYESLENKRPTLRSLIKKFEGFEIENIPANELESFVMAVSKELEWYLRLCVKGTLRERRKSSEVAGPMAELLGLEHYSVNKRGLGHLVNEDLPKLFEEYEMDGKYPAQKIRDKLVKSRNKFAHPGNDVPKLSLEDTVNFSTHLVENGKQYLQLLEETSITLPIPITIVSVKETYHGYVEIIGNTTDGAELIFLHPDFAKDIKVASTLYMIASNNPIRMNPVLFDF